jgi:2,4-dienoyl-CoA reductase (NADPH2)
MGKDPLFDPLEIGGRRSRNRVAALPLFTGYATPDGGVTPLLREHYWRMAASGAGLVVVANVAVSKDGRTSPRTLRLDDDRFVDELARLAGTIQHRGALACVQLNHAGRFAHTERPLLPAPVDAAHLDHDIAALKHFMHAFPFAERFGLTAKFMQMSSGWRQAMTPEDRDRVVQDFGRAARRAVAAGFDLLELHGATGYLLSQFLSAFTNRPPGPWSGSFDNRVAFVEDVVQAVRQNVPDGFPIGYRLLVQEWVPEGVDREEAALLARRLQQKGVAYLSVSAGTYNSMFSRRALALARRPAYLLEDTRALRQVVDLPLILGGRVFRPNLARQVLEEGAADMVGLGRPLLADPGWLKKARAGQRVHVCIDCRHCLKRVIQDKGLACARWPEIEIERVDLERTVHRRMNACLLYASPVSLSIPPEMLPVQLPGSEDRRFRLVYVTPGGQAGSGAQAAANHWKRVQAFWRTAGQSGRRLESVFRESGLRTYDEVLAAARKDGFGMLVLADGRNVRLGEVLASKWRDGVFIAASTDADPGTVFVAVDLSPSTHLLMRFVSYGYRGRHGFRFRFVHVLEGDVQAARKRWEKMLPVSGWDPDTPLEMLTPGPGGVAGTLLNAAGGWGTIVVGRRGISRIKSFLLGSVSRRILRAGAGATVVIVS